MKSIITIILVLIFSQLESFGQCYPDRHSTVKADAWESCVTSPNPNEIRGESHWIMYDLSTIHNLGPTTFWNYNDPDDLDKGLRNVLIDYSIDGSTWIELGAFDFPQASGKSIYEGFDGPNFEGRSMRYILITATENWGDESCFGIAEMRAQIQENVLPVTVLNFKGSCKEDLLKFEWKVADQLGISFYKIESAADGSNWKEIDRVKANSKTNYESSFDQSLSVGNLFRLVSVDQDGLEAKHEIISIECETTKTSVFPNPFNNQVEMVWTEDFDSDFEIQIIDALGRIIHVIQVDHRTNKERINTARLSAGAYTLRAFNKEKTVEFKLVKSNK